MGAKRNRRRLDLHSLSVQMALSFVALVLLTTAAAGLPAIWGVRRQLERQSWAQVAQGERATRALYASRQAELAGLATLIAQRPTLGELLARRDHEALGQYLETLRAGASLDFVLACDPEGRSLLGASGDAGPEAAVPALCAPSPAESAVVFYSVVEAPYPRVWMVARHAIFSETAASSSVVVGIALDAGFAAQMREQTGLEHTLVVGQTPAATSLPDAQSIPVIPETPATFDVAGAPYYATRIALDETGLVDIVALEVGGIAATQRQLATALGAGVLGVAIVGSLLGLYLAHRVGAPLLRLADVAAKLERRGELLGLEQVVPSTEKSTAREIALVAQALQVAQGDVVQMLTELRQEKAWVDHLLEAVVEGIVTLDSRGRVTFFSSGAERITGLRQSEVLGQVCNDIFQPLETDQSFIELIPPPGGQSKITVVFQDGRQAILAVTGARMLPPGGDDTRVALVFRDVSEEETVHRLVGHFLANVSHEFRTPLSALAASVELLVDQAPYLSPTELKELLTSLHLSVLGLQTLVDNLLESASIEAGRFHVYVRPCSAREIVAETLHIVQPLLDKRAQRLILSLPDVIPQVHADFRRTVQVLVNLLGNASKYGLEGTSITVDLTVEKGWVCIAVMDQGPGIPKDRHKYLFHRFSRLGTEYDKTKEGVGLGLSVVKAIVEAQGGQVGVEVVVGGGTSFWFTLPVVSEE